MDVPVLEVAVKQMNAGNYFHLDNDAKDNYKTSCCYQLSIYYDLFSLMLRHFPLKGWQMKESLELICDATETKCILIFVQLISVLQSRFMY